jgi:glycosyltransferase involved in cell wall biosynthesis
MNGIEYSIVVPVFNSEDTLIELFERLKKVMADIGKGFEVIFVEDGGRDGSWEVIRGLKEKYPEEITAIQLSKNFGQHNATFCGLSFAKGRYIITIDDDLQNPPEEITKLIECYQQNDADMVYGVYKRKKHSTVRNVVSKSFQEGSKRLNKGKGKGSSFRMMNAEIVHKILEHHQTFIFIDEIFQWYTERVFFINVDHDQRKGKRSGYSSGKLIRLFANITFFYSSIPLKLMVYTGLIFSVLFFIIGAFYIYRKIVHDVPLGFTSLIVAIMFSTGIILFSLGMIGEYLSRIYMVQNKKPPFTIKNKL